MPLIDRILGLEDPKLPVHEFSAALVEYKRGYVTGPQVVEAFDLSPQEAVQLDTWLSNLDTDTISREEIEDVLMLGEGGYYPKATVISRLAL